MSRDILEIVQEMNPQGLKRQMVMQCAPVITGLKLSNLLTIPGSCIAEMRVLLMGSDISWYVLRATKEKITLLLYRENDLQRYLQSPEARDLLLRAGYDCVCLSKALARLRRRYMKSRSDGGEFPHEMGIFLGYPIQDVRGFMENKGQDFLYSGYWKVYSEVEEKKQLFGCFEKARETLIRLLNQGLSLSDIMTVYSAARHQYILNFGGIVS